MPPATLSDKDLHLLGLCWLAFEGPRPKVDMKKLSEVSTYNTEGSARFAFYAAMKRLNELSEQGKVAGSAVSASGNVVVEDGNGENAGRSIDGKTKAKARGRARNKGGAAKGKQTSGAKENAAGEGAASGQESTAKGPNGKGGKKRAKADDDDDDEDDNVYYLGTKPTKKAKTAPKAPEAPKVEESEEEEPEMEFDIDEV
ncbi:MAG: hypothetical protein M1821_004335 [Bathelium mastoideum]|nr:MAG: hypothetical protein M1821_004335 [Bathelium mastoideum]KAI9683999.1 MAG: hypothetical protein M1822_005826 [Bathelium mastoideum]